MDWDRVRHILHSIWLALVVLVNVLVSLGLVCSGYFGLVSPQTCQYGVVVVMTFPAWLAAAVLLLILDLIFWKRTAMTVGVALVVSTPQIGEYLPLNVPKLPMSASERSHSFTLMTYNVMHFAEATGEPGMTVNQQMEYILGESPDVVCIEEALCLQPTSGNRISQEQIDRMRTMYPYVFVSEDLALLSKFPAEPLPVQFPVHAFRSGAVAGWRLHIPDDTDKDVDELVVDSLAIMGGRIVNLFVVHLRSMGYSGEEREMFRQATDGPRIRRSEIEEVRTTLLPTLVEASYDRDRQAQILVSQLARYGGETAIVAGDFNDVTCCRALTMLCDEADMKTVYSQVGFGPMITFNSSHFYFHIDHVLYRGRLRPYSFVRGDLTASDHYPVTVTFQLD